MESTTFSTSKKVEKVHNFLDSPLPQDVLDFLEFGENWKLLEPPPSDLIREKFEIGKILNFGNPPSEKKNKLKTLQIAKKSL